MTMNVFLGSGTAKGEPWMPDEVAKALVEKHKLRKGMTLSKRAIVDYMESQGLPAHWAPDVAMVLRNMFGVVPTFDEEREMSSNLIEELNTIISTDYNNPRDPVVAPVVIDPEKMFEEAIQEVFAESTDEVDDLVIAGLAGLTPEDVAQIAALSNVLGEQEIDEIDECFARGGLPLVEAWCDLEFRPHSVRFMSEDTIGALGEILSEGPVGLAGVASHAARRMKQSDVSAAPQLTLAQGSRKLARRAAAAKEIQRRGGSAPISPMGAPKINVGDEDPLKARMGASTQGIPHEPFYGPGKFSRGQIRKKLGQATDRMVGQQPSNLPQDQEAPHPKASAIKAALGKAAGLAGRVGSAVKSGAGKAALGAAGGIGKAVGAYQAARDQTRGAIPSDTVRSAPETEPVDATPAAVAPGVTPAAAAVAGKKPGLMRRILGRAGQVIAAKAWRNPAISNLMRAAGSKGPSPEVDTLMKSMDTARDEKETRQKLRHAKQMRRYQLKYMKRLSRGRR